MRLARLRHLAIFLATAATTAAAGFLDQLDPDQRKRLGLDQLTPAQLYELEAAVESYRKTGEVAAARKAAETAVAEYRKQEEPGVITRAIESLKRKDSDDTGERITAVLAGKFTGWSGSTLFRLDNGQVWRQAAPDSYHTKARENVPIVIYKSPSGYYRLRILDDEGAWVTVKRVQ